MAEKFNSEDFLHCGKSFFLCVFYRDTNFANIDKKDQEGLFKQNYGTEKIRLQKIIIIIKLVYRLFLTCCSAEYLRLACSCKKGCMQLIWTEMCGCTSVFKYFSKR
jgi:hypothetical protein